MQHLEIYGLNEGRDFSLPFDVDYYKSHSDLVAAGFNFKQAYDHYVLYGYNEGRLGAAPPTRQWIQQLVTADYDSSNGVAVDSAGNIFLARNTSTYQKYPSDPNQEDVVDRDAWVAKYDSGGNQLWLQQLITNGYDKYDRVAVDTAGNVYIAGTSNGLREDSGISYALVAKYDSSGNRLWIHDFGGYIYNESHGIAVNSAGSVYITGININTHAGGSSSWVTKYNSIGHQLWEQDFGSSSLYNYWESAEKLSVVAVDSTGNFYLTGNIYNSHNSIDNARVAKYS